MSRTLVLGALGVLALAATVADAQVAISADGVIESSSGGFRFPDGRVQATAVPAAAAPVADSGQRRCFEPSGDVGAEIACGGTGQDGEKQAGADWPAPRFTDNQDGSVTDNLTGLVWLETADCLGLPVTFQEALFTATLIADGACGLSDGSAAGDWRVPNVNELLSLIHFGRELPAMAPAHPFQNLQDVYWTSTTFLPSPRSAWEVTVATGVPFWSPKDLSNNYFWVVRDGPSARSPDSASVEGRLRSTSGGFRFADGTVQTTAASRRAPVARTGQTTCYDPTGSTSDTVPCGGTGQDGDGQAGVPWPMPRFTDNLDGTVIDHLTGLIWLKDGSCSMLGTTSFDVALTAVGSLETGFCDLSDGSKPGEWRLPSIRELLSLVDYGREDPSLPAGNPFEGVCSALRCWSSTTFLRDPSEAWSIEMREPFVFGEDKDQFQVIWPVRGGR